MRVNEHIRYEPDEPCPVPLALGVAVQYVLLILPPTLLVVILTVRASDQDDGYLTWAVFAAFIINAIITTIQAVRLWRFGCGLTVVTGPTIQFVAVTALAAFAGRPCPAGDPPRCVVALPVRGGRVAPRAETHHHAAGGRRAHGDRATIIPVVFDSLADVPEGKPPESGPIVALVTLAVAAALALRASGCGGYGPR